MNNEDNNINVRLIEKINNLEESSTIWKKAMEKLFPILRKYS